MEDSIANNVQLFVVIGSLVTVVLVAAIVLFFLVHQKKMYRSQLAMEKQTAQHRLEMLHAMNEAEEKEKTKIAATIHDQVGSILFSAKSQAGFLAATSADGEISETAKNIEELIILGYDELRKSIYSLSPSLLEKFGFTQAIDEYYRIIGTNSKVEFEYSITGEYILQGKNVEVAIYRVLQEVVNNALKHSGCNKISTLIKQEPDYLKIRISDNGQGFDLEEKMKTGGLGLRNIRNRLQLINGLVEINSEKGIGTSFDFLIPTKSNQ